MFRYSLSAAVALLIANAVPAWAQTPDITVNNPNVTCTGTPHVAVSCRDVNGVLVGDETWYPNGQVQSVTTFNADGSLQLHLVDAADGSTLVLLTPGSQS